MKKLSTLFALFMLCIGQTFAYNFAVGDIYYNIVGYGNAEVTYASPSYNSYSGTVSIPATVTDDATGVTYNVTGIGTRAFNKCAELTSVTIPCSVTSIGNYAFYGCSTLPSVTIPSSVTSIGSYAFYGCTGLTSVTIPSSVTSIGDSAFKGCDNVTELIYAEGCKSTLRTYLTKITSVTIPNSVESISDNAFSGCSGLTTVTIPSSVTNIGSAAFSGCTGLTSVTIPNSVTSIGYSAFSGCTGLTSITIPSSVTSIEYSAFQNCKGLTTVTIPSSVTSIGSNAFSGCSGLTTVTIPSSVTSIGNYAFSGCSGLTTVTIPSSVTSIGNSAFQHCTGLTSVTIPSSVTSINEMTFYNCLALTSVTIPSSVTSIGDSAFKGCTGLASVTIPNSVKSIGSAAFSDCSSLQDIYDFATEPQTMLANSFNTFGTLHVLEGYADVYAADEFWSQFSIVDDIIILSIDFTDGEEYTQTEEKTYAELTYARTFSSTDWQALYVPFSMTYDDWKDYMDVYDIYNVLAYDEDNDGVIERTTVNMIRLKEGAVTEPNYPYVIRAKNKGPVEITLEGATLYPAEENSIYCCSTKQKFTFTGNYKKLTGLYTTGSYALQGGVLKTAINDDVELKPQRWYMDVTNRNGSPAAATRIFLNPFGEEDEVEGVKGVAVNIIGEETTYDMGGRTVNANQLPKGLYVRGGKKIIVR